MSTHTVKALEDLQEHQLLLVLGDTARVYTGSGAELGASLAVAPQHIAQGTCQDVQLGVTFRLDPQSEPARTHAFDAEIDALWLRLSAAMSAISQSERGREVLADTIERDEVMVRTTGAWNAFGFVLDRRDRQFWGWRRIQDALEELWVDLTVHRDRLCLVHDGREVVEEDLVLALAERLDV